MQRAKTALVTGSRGFVGRHMVTRLRNGGYEVDPWDIAQGNDCMRLFRDLTSRRYDLIVHAAAMGPNRKAIDTEPRNFPYNVMLDAAMFQWAARTKPGKIVYLSSCGVYRSTGKRTPYMEEMCELKSAMSPWDTYGWTKLNGEQMAHAARTAGQDVLVVRPFSGYGEDQSDDFPFNAIVGRAMRHEDPLTVWGDGLQVRDWVHIDDICDAIMALLPHSDHLPPAVNLCTGVGHTMKDVARIAAYHVGYEPEIQAIGGAHGGDPYRVGNPSLLHVLYEPKILLGEGITRRIHMGV